MQAVVSDTRRGIEDVQARIDKYITQDVDWSSLVGAHHLVAFHLTETENSGVIYASEKPKSAGLRRRSPRLKKLLKKVRYSLIRVELCLSYPQPKLG
jgi:hypothetical protein